MATESPTAFFSYSRDDSEFTLRLAGDLKASGAKVWLDQLDIEAGQNWPLVVQDALSNAQRVLVVLSPSAVKSSNVMNEVTFALEEGKRVIPVLRSDCKIPLQLRGLQYVNFHTDYDHGLQSLLKALAAPPAAGKAASDSVVSSQGQPEVFGTDPRQREAQLLMKDPKAAPDQKPAWLGKNWKWALSISLAVVLLVVGTIFFVSRRSAPNPKLAAWYQQAMAGDSNAMESLGIAYARGDFGLKQDYTQAAVWDRKAAEAGNPAGMAALGALYANGQGVPLDYPEARKWFQQAAQAGEPSAMADLGIMYEKGNGVEIDRQQSIMWYRKAAQLGNQYAKDQLTRLGVGPQ